MVCVNINIIFYLIFGIILFLMLCKAVETICIDIASTLINGKKRLLEFEQDLISIGHGGAIKKYIAKRKYARFINRRIPSKFLSNYFYRWFILTPIASILVLFITNKVFVWVSISIILFSIFIEIFNEIVERLGNGIASNIHFNAHVDITQELKEIDMSFSSITKRICISLILRMTVIWLGFAGIYFAINTMSNLAFKGMNDYIDALYFSLIAITTTGYGDIFPISPESKLFVICQISLSWIFLITVLFHYGATITFFTSTTRDGGGNSPQ